MCVLAETTEARIQIEPKVGFNGGGENKFQCLLEGPLKLGSTQARFRVILEHFTPLFQPAVEHGVERGPEETEWWKHFRLQLRNEAKFASNATKQHQTITMSSEGSSAGQWDVLQGAGQKDSALLLMESYTCRCRNQRRVDIFRSVNHGWDKEPRW